MSSTLVIAYRQTTASAVKTTLNLDGSVSVTLVDFDYISNVGSVDSSDGMFCVHADNDSIRYYVPADRILWSRRVRFGEPAADQLAIGCEDGPLTTTFPDLTR